jgi:hypothetical protein
MRSVTFISGKEGALGVRGGIIAAEASMDEIGVTFVMVMSDKVEHRGFLSCVIGSTESPTYMMA